MASIHLQPGKPNWFCHYATADGTRRSRSTKTPNKNQARIICQTWQAAARKQSKPGLAPDQARQIIAKGVAEIFAIHSKEQLTEHAKSLAEPDLPPGLLSVRRKTLADVARAAGVSRTTVSLTLASHPKIPVKTRERIKSVVKRIGYRPDPVLSALMVYRQGTKPSGNQETLAWINVWPDPRLLHQAFAPYWEGTLERCQELGFKLEEFRLSDFGMRTARLSQILRARNIHGLFIPPQHRNRAHLHLEWDNFSAIAFGYTLARPQLHVVTNAQFRSTVIAMRALRKLGHRRIGFVVAQYLDERTDHNYIGGYLADRRRVASADQIPPLVINDVGAGVQGKFLEWYETHRPEAILTSGWFVEQWLQDAGYKAKRDYSLALLVIRDPKESGIDQNEHATGRTAADLLVGMMHRGERGIPPIPLRTLIEGRWVEGNKVRRLVPSLKA